MASFLPRWAFEISCIRSGLGTPRRLRQSPAPTGRDHIVPHGGPDRYIATARRAILWAWTPCPTNSRSSPSATAAIRWAPSCRCCGSTGSRSWWIPALPSASALRPPASQRHQRPAHLPHRRGQTAQADGRCEDRGRDGDLSRPAHSVRGGWPVGNPHDFAGGFSRLRNAGKATRHRLPSRPCQSSQHVNRWDCRRSPRHRRKRWRGSDQSCGH